MRQVLLASVLSLVAVGCGTGSYKLIEKPDTTLQRYTSVYFSPMQTEAWLVHIQERARPKWKHVLTHAPRLFKEGAEQKLAGSFRVVQKPEEGTLIIESELQDFDPGSRASRILLLGGITGAGTGEMTVLCTLIDSEDMSPIGSAEATGTVRWGWIGGSFISTYSRCGAGAAGFVLEHR